MSHEIVKSISIKKDKVFLTSADSSLRPLHFHRWECEGLSEILREKGRVALLASIGEDIWSGNLHLRRGNKLCQLFLEARNAFPRDMHYTTFDCKTAGSFLGQMVSALEKDPSSDLSVFVQRALEKRNDRDYILDAAMRTGHNYLNYASEDVQKDRAFALGVLRAGGGTAWFDYPQHFRDDKAFALEALKLNGCFYRQLSDGLKADKEIIRKAFAEEADKRYHEHLPDLIPPEVYCSFNASTHKLEIDKSFILRLLDICPSMHMDRIPYLLTNREIVLKWAQVGKFFPYSFSELPQEYKSDPEVQKTLIKRFENTDQYEILMQRFVKEGITPQITAFDTKLREASARAAESCSASQIPEHESKLQR